MEGKIGIGSDKGKKRKPGENTKIMLDQGIIYNKETVSLDRCVRNMKCKLARTQL
jgi:hypothetical protein